MPLHDQISNITGHIPLLRDKLLVTHRIIMILIINILVVCSFSLRDHYHWNKQHCQINFKSLKYEHRKTENFATLVVPQNENCHESQLFSTIRRLLNYFNFFQPTLLPILSPINCFYDGLEN
jgi:cell division protein FtsL